VLALTAGGVKAEEMLLYTPKEVAGAQAPASPKEGVLVRSVTVQRGDTLAKISRKHIGVADYFPQMLVFNSIKNPDLIHPGQRILVPVRPGQKAQPKKHHAARRTVSKPRRHVASAANAPTKPGEQDLFQGAQRTYLEHDYRTALGRFNDFLQKYPHSRFAADASLYRADCFLHLSGE
jgi:TolA-binding protein